MNKQILSKLMVTLFLTFGVSGAIADGTAAVESGYQTNGEKAIATTNKTPNAFVDAANAYNDSWATQGCSREAWTELTNSYNASMNDLKAKSQVLDQRIFDGIKLPQFINLKNFEFLGCDLGSSFDNLQSIYEKAMSIYTAINSGDFKGMMEDTIKKTALSIVKNYAEKQLRAVCSKVQSEISKIDNEVFGTANKITSQYSDPAGLAASMMQQAAQQLPQVK